ncbi:MAG: hypothetical protein PHG89_10230 [Gallionella sp.]|nr:hypothetical protein [Gallionella sp.]
MTGMHQAAICKLPKLLREQRDALREMAWIIWRIDHVSGNVQPCIHDPLFDKKLIFRSFHNP